MRKVSQAPSSIPSASRTLSRHRNPIPPYPSIQQLPPVRLPQIQPHLPGVPDAKQRIRIPKPSSKLRPDLLPHRIATSPDTRPHGRYQVAHPRSKLVPHLPDPVFDNPRHRSPPARMKRRHHSLLHIHHQHWNTIRGPHCEQYPGNLSHQPIPLEHRLTLGRLKPPFRRTIVLLHHPHNPRVNLPHPHQRKAAQATGNCIEKSSSVLPYCSGIIFFRPAQIERTPIIQRTSICPRTLRDQRLSSINCRNPTPSRTEPMPQPPESLPPRYLNDLQIAIVRADSRNLSVQLRLASSRPSSHVRTAPPCCPIYSLER